MIRGLRRAEASADKPRFSFYLFWLGFLELAELSPRLALFWILFLKGE
jgi:hypothetical protein